MLAFLVLAAGLASPSDEAMRPGTRLARTSGLFSIAPALIQRDLGELAKRMPRCR